MLIEIILHGLLTNLDNFMLDEEAMKHYRGEAWEMSSEKVIVMKHWKLLIHKNIIQKWKEVDDCPF